MALSIGVREGDVVDIGDHAMKVIKMVELGELVVEMGDGKRYTVYQDESTKVAPGVFVGIGKKTTYIEARIAIEAPKSMKIARR